jgi:DNA-binding CsgD family transcriptional regulator
MHVTARRARSEQSRCGRRASDVLPRDMTPPFLPTAPAAPATAPVTTVPGLPAWVTAVDQAVWVTGPDRSLRWLNRKAEVLLGLRAADWVGKPCHVAVQGRDSTGRPFCTARCRLCVSAERREPVAPVDFEVGPRGPRARWTRVTTVPVETPAGAVLVHLATDLDRERRLSRWMERVADRSAPIRAADPRPTRALTPRESEILDLLVEDVELPRIAHLLGISKTTVRNHVQRMLAAIDAHSIQEAVALRLLGRA